MAGLCRLTLDDFELVHLETIPDFDDPRRCLTVDFCESSRVVTLEHDFLLYVPERYTTRCNDFAVPRVLTQTYRQPEPTERVDENCNTHLVDSVPKVIDTRTFTRPRKNRSLNSTAVLNQTVAYKFDGDDALSHNPGLVDDCLLPDPALITGVSAVNQTFTQDSSPHLNGPLNGTFLLDHSPADIEGLNNNNCALNATFTANGLVGSPEVPATLDATFDVSPESEASPELKEETVFKKPQMIHVKKTGLVRTSTLKDEAAVDNLPLSPFRPPQIAGLSSTPMATKRQGSAPRINDFVGSPIAAVNQDQQYHSDESLEHPPSTTNADAKDCFTATTVPQQGPTDLGKSPTENLTFVAEEVAKSPTSSMGSRYSSQSLESDSAAANNAPARQDVVHRSMPDLKSSQNAGHLQNLPLDGRHLNRLHGSETGLRPPSASNATLYGARPKAGLRPPLTRPPVFGDTQRPTAGQIPSALPQPFSGLRMPGIRKPAFTSALPRPDTLNATVTVEPAPLPPPSRTAAAIPRPTMTRIPGPRGIPQPSVSTSKLRFVRPPAVERK